MSLFRAREWWSHRPAGGEEECHAGCMAVGDADNSGGQLVVTGSFEGVLRVYCPRQAGFRVEDLLLERRLGLPVLGVLLGRFTPGGRRAALAVLHPRRLVVYEVRAAGAGAAAGYHELAEQYAHELERPAFNMTAGPFGGLYDRDFLCVQSVDGLLSFFEQNRPSFSVRLPGFVLPGPICYVEKTDCVVTVSTSMEVCAYRYQVLAAAGAAAAAARGPGSGSSDSISSEPADDGLGRAGKAVRADWTANVGEQALELRVGRFTRSLAAGQVEILVLGERTLFVLRETGAVRSQKRFDYHPSCMVTYPVGPAPRPSASAAGGAGEGGGEGVSGASAASAKARPENLLVGTHDSALMVYSGARLAWSARMADADAGSPPVALAVAELGGLRGLVVALTDRCELTVSYLGTDPPSRSVRPAEKGEGAAQQQQQKQPDYEGVEREHRQLLATIKRAQSDAAAEPAEQLSVSCQVPDRLDPPGEYPDDAHADQGDGGDALVRDGDAGTGAQFASVTARVYLRLAGAAEARGVAVSLDVPDGVHADRTTLDVAKVRGGAAPHEERVRFRVRAGVPPASMLVRAVASYTTDAGHPRTARCEFELPLCLAAEVRPPVKNARFTLTLDTALSPPPPLVDLFPDVLLPAIRRTPDLQRTAAGVLSLFSRATGEDATVLVSKKAGRYRVQGGSFDALWTLADALCRRLAAAGGHAAFSGPLPLQDYFAAVDAHFEARAAVRRQHARLERESVRFRAVQKRLLARFRDKNPAPLDGLDRLLAECDDRVVSRADALERAQGAEREAAARLSAATRLFLSLVRMHCRPAPAVAAALDRYWTADVAGFSTQLAPSAAAADGDVGDEGWHEVVDAGLRHMLANELSRTGRAARAAGADRPGPAHDTAKLKKHMQAVCERLVKARTK